MAYGNDFGGVQAAAQAQDRSRSSDYFNQLQAQRAAEALNLNAVQADRSYGLQMRQLNDAAQARADAQRIREQEQAAGDARYGLEYLTRLGDTSFNRDTTLENQALQRDQFDLNKEAQDQKLLTGVDQVHNQGAALAQDLGDAVAKRAEAVNKLQGLETYTAKLKQATVNNKLTDPQSIPRMQSLLVGIADQMKAAQRDLAVSDFNFKKATSQAINLGFVPQGDKLIHGRTGKVFSLMTPDAQDEGGDTVTGTASYFQNVARRPMAPTGPTTTFGAFKAQPMSQILWPYGDAAQAPTPAPAPSGTGWDSGFSAMPQARPVGPATPQTPEDFASLAPGTLYVNPSNGVIFRKK